VTDQEKPFGGDPKVLGEGVFPHGEVVYFVQARGGGPIKIGWSTYLEKRLQEMRAHSPLPLRVLLCVKGGLADEKILHQRFKEDRLHNEWFKPSERLLNYIRSLKRRRERPYEELANKMLEKEK